MKSFTINLAMLCTAAFVGGAIVYWNEQKTPPVAAPVAASPAAPTEPAPEEIVAAKPVQPRRMAAPAAEATPVPVTNSALNDVKPDSAASALSQTVDTLISPQTSFSDRQALWKQLKSAGQLDQAIAELKQRAAGASDDAEIPTALGEAYLHKFPVQDYNESAILGMEVDQSFNAALKIDPANWEAQYFKADAMSYWPMEMNKAPEVIQALSSLIDQQQTMQAQPQFAQTYALLGDEYQKTGQPDYARQTWRLGLAQFPQDPVLQQKFANR